MTEWYFQIGNREYGPVTEEELIDLIEAGEVLPSHLVWTEDMEDWVPISEVFELQIAPPDDEDQFESSEWIEAESEPQQPLQPDRTGPSPSQQETFEPTGREKENPAIQINPLALASLVLAILGCCVCLPTIPAVICGHAAIAQIDRNPEQYTGKNMAVAGLALGYLAILLWIAFFFLGKI